MLSSTNIMRVSVFVFLVSLVGAFILNGEEIRAQSCPINARYRTFDGTCNNLIFPALGSTGQFYRRGDEGAEYQADGSPVTNRPIERVVSNMVARSDPNEVDSTTPHSLMATQFGQFINHDLNNNAFEDPDSVSYPDPVPVPEKDDSFCFVYADLMHGNMTLINVCGPPQNQVPLFTTKFSARVAVHRQPEVFSMATAWLDLSQVYGTTPTIASLLRTHQGGKMLMRDYVGVTTSPSQTFGFFQFGFGPTPPYSCLNCPPSWGQLNGQVPVNPLMDPNKVHSFHYDPNKIFVAGDVRIGENGALSMFHTLFLRNHNRHAARIAALLPDLDDEELYQRARRRNIAEYQNIVMYQYFPSEFGEHFSERIGEYRRYNSFIDADTAVAFASAAFRYGHSSFRNYAPISQCGAPTMFGMAAGNVKLMFGGQTGGPILPMDVYGEVGSWENVIRGLIATRTAPNDVMIDAALRDLPFNFPFAGGTDIFALDLRRGRENGVPNYVTLQKVYGRHRDRIYGEDGCPERFSRNQLNDPQECFDRLARDNDTLARNLRDLYGKVNRVDALLGLLIERHAPGTSFGETLGNIIADTYRRVRDGDRYWFENRHQPYAFNEDSLEEIRNTGMDDLLRKNFDFPTQSQIPANPFLTPNRYLNTLGRTTGCPSS